jgi:ATP-dependent protease HslVU (ClpYQ) peptidase subunit
MTTIAANHQVMAADTQVTSDDTCYYAEKIFRIGDELIGCAGESEACLLFAEWYPRRAEEEFKLPRDCEDNFQALVLNHGGLFIYGKRGKCERVRDGVMAIGSGQALALAAFDTMQMLGENPDPELAVKISRMRNNMTGGDIQVEDL